MTAVDAGGLFGRWGRDHRLGEVAKPTLRECNAGVRLADMRGWTMRRAIAVLVLVGLAFPATVQAHVTVDGCYAHLSGTGGPDVYFPDGSWESHSDSDFTDEFQPGTYRVVWVENDNVTETFTIRDCPAEPDSTDEPGLPPVREWIPADDAPEPGDVVEPAVHPAVALAEPTRMDAPAYVFRLARRP